MSTRTFQPVDQQQVAESIEQAIREGRHSREHQTVCPTCREWVSGLWFVRRQGSKVEMCRSCCKDAGMDVSEVTR